MNNNNIKLIDATNVETIEDSIKHSHKQYSIEDCIMVRTTDIFPFDGIVQTPINGNAYEFGKSTFLGDIIVKELNKKYPNHFYDEDEANKYSNELKEYAVIFETLRRTVHFTLNGLVGSTAYGNFDNKPFVIFEPLKYHLNESLKSLRVEDTYFDDDLCLSDESAILISEEIFNQISKDPNYINDLQRFNIYIYNGNQQVAVSKVLNDMGYDSFLISSHGYVNGINDGSAASNMWHFTVDFAKKNNFSLEKHFYSKINLEDALMREEKSKEIDKLHLLYIIDNSTVSPDLGEKIKLLLESNESINDLLELLVEQIGFEQLKKLTKDFNNNYIASLNKAKNSKKY